MAKKTMLGVDIGYDRLKLSLVSGGRVLATAAADMPDSLKKEGRITSPEAMAELIKNTMKDAHIHNAPAAYVLPGESVYVKNVEMPLMTIDQLVYNLPFEFNDYVTGEVKDYVFDYAVLPDKEPENNGEENAEENAEESGSQKGNTMHLMAVGTLRSVVEEAEDILHKAGLKLVKAAPALCSYISLIRAQQESNPELGGEFGLLDLGYQEIRMYMYHGDQYVATRVLESGLFTLDEVLAEEMGVETHLAHTYLMSNFDDCQNKEVCMMAYERIAVELNRALNFYSFSNPDSNLSDLWVVGGGALIRPLLDMITEMMDIQLHPAQELIPGGDAIDECNSFVQSIGIAMD